MTILGYDGIDGYGAETQIAGRWASASSALIPNTASGRFGRGGVTLPAPNTAGSLRTKVFTQANTIGAGCAVKIGTTLSPTDYWPAPLFFLKAGTIQCGLRVYGDGRVAVERGSTLVGSISTLSFSQNAWHWLEAKATCERGV